MTLHETHVCRDCGAEITVPYVRSTSRDSEVREAIEALDGLLRGIAHDARDHRGPWSDFLAGKIVAALAILARSSEGPQADRPEAGPTEDNREAPCRHCLSDWHYTDEHVSEPTPHPFQFAFGAGPDSFCVTCNRRRADAPHTDVDPASEAVPVPGLSEAWQAVINAALDIAARSPIDTDGETGDTWCHYCESFDEKHHKPWCDYLALTTALAARLAEPR